MRIVVSCATAILLLSAAQIPAADVLRTGRPATGEPRAALTPLTAPEGTPTDDPYLPSTDHLPPGTVPDPIHQLDRVRSTWWELPRELAEEYVGHSPGQRVVFRDTLTRTEVWLLRRTPGNDGEGFYSTQRSFNADGSMIEISRSIMGVDGSDIRAMDALVDRQRDRTAVQKFLWDDRDPAVALCKRFSNAIFRYSFRTGQEWLVFKPNERVPGDCMIVLSDRDDFMLIARQKNDRAPFVYLADGKGTIIREIELRTISKDPSEDHMGGLSLYRDQHGKYFIIYSLNKSAAQTSNPHQGWLAALDGAVYIERSKWVGNMHEGYMIGGKRHFLRLAGRDPLAPSLGHSGMSPSGQYLVGRERTSFLCLTDLERRDLRYLAYVPSADHIDWSARVNWFLVRTRRQPGLPIYRVDVPSGIAHRIVATNTSDHLDCFSYSHPSPDGTKCLFRSSMLGNIDMYLAVIRHPAPPQGLELRREADRVRLSWQAPDPGREIKGYRVYRSNQSGGLYEPIVRNLVTGTWYQDPAPQATAYYVVTSVEHSGLESRAFSREVSTDWGKGAVNLFWEAESGELAFPMREVFLPPGASAAYAITRAVRDPLWRLTRKEATAEWRMRIPKQGTYILWARVRTRPGHAAPSGLSFALAGSELAGFTGERPTWAWVRLSGETDLTAGSHTMVCTMTRSGCELDKLLLTTDPEYVPSDKGNLPVAAPRPTAAVEAALDQTGKHVLLHWRHDAGPLFCHYDVYKGTVPGFAPSQRALLGSPVRCAFVDPMPPEAGRVFYRIQAVDTWGNRSTPSAAVGVTIPDRGPTVHVFIDVNMSHVRGSVRAARDPEAANDTCVVLDKAAKNGRIEIPLSLPPGRYLVWGRVKSKGRYQSAQLRLTHGGNALHCSVCGVGRKLFSEFMWSWHRVLCKDRHGVPRWSPLFLEVAQRPCTITIEYLSGYAELDQLFLTSSVHDLPSPEAAWYKPVDDYRFARPK